MTSVPSVPEPVEGVEGVEGEGVSVTIHGIKSPDLPRRLWGEII